MGLVVDPWASVRPRVVAEDDREDGGLESRAQGAV